ncbi:GNAT family N-acetyltransferase [Chromobacterium sp. CV08]|uniref:GNAT family N-acetyltransferase n=1 Tax=Chromobacterium sp. CV08 TaxID=3133274 RepID=UPI003DA7EF4D
MLTVQDLPCPPNDFSIGNPDGPDFYRAFSLGCLPGFRHGFFVVERGGHRLCCIPYFVTGLELNTLLPRGRLFGLLPKLTIPMACAGHPVTDLGRMEGALTAEIVEEVTRRLGQKGRLIAWKGFGDDLPLDGYARVKGLPVPVIRFDGDYYASLKSERRNLLRRKLKKAAGLRYEVSDGLPADLLGRIYALYLQTWRKAPMKFGRLSPDYFTATSGDSTYLLFYLRNELIGFTQLLGRGDAMMNAFVGLDYAHAWDHGLYFAMFIRSVELAQQRGCAEIELGATCYEFKRILGAQQLPTWNYFRHQSAPLNWLLSRCASLLEPSAEDLK